MFDPDEKDKQAKELTTYEQFLLDENPENVTSDWPKPVDPKTVNITLDVQNMVIRIAADREK